MRFRIKDYLQQKKKKAKCKKILMSDLRKF